MQSKWHTYRSLCLNKYPDHQHSLRESENLSQLLFDQQALSLGSGSLPLGWRSLGALSESVLCSSKDMFQVSHSAGSLSVSPLCLDGPVVYYDDVYSIQVSYIFSWWHLGDLKKRIASSICARFVYRWFCSRCGSCCYDHPWTKFP